MQPEGGFSDALAPMDRWWFPPAIRHQHLSIPGIPTESFASLRTSGRLARQTRPRCAEEISAIFGDTERMAAAQKAAATELAHEQTLRSVRNSNS